MSDLFGLVKSTWSEQRTETTATRDQIAPRASHGVTRHRGRPFIGKSIFWCAKCQAEPKMCAHYFAETFQEERSKLTPEQLKAFGGRIYDCGEGYAAGTITCHGQSLEFLATFDQAWAAHDLGQKIVVFDGQLRLSGDAKSAPQPELSKPAVVQQAPRKPPGVIDIEAEVISTYRYGPSTQSGSASSSESTGPAVKSDSASPETRPAAPDSPDASSVHE